MNLKQILSENYPSVIKQYCMPIHDIKVLLDKHYNVLQMYGTSTVAKLPFWNCELTNMNLSCPFPHTRGKVSCPLPEYHRFTPPLLTTRQFLGCGESVFSCICVWQKAYCFDVWRNQSMVPSLLVPSLAGNLSSLLPVIQSWQLK